MAYLMQKDADGSSSKQWTLSETPLKVGRDHTMDAQIDDPAMSRHHFTVEHRNGYHVLVDCQSTNGTWVNHERVAEIKLLPNDRITAGETHFVFVTGMDTMVLRLSGQRAAEEVD